MTKVFNRTPETAKRRHLRDDSTPAERLLWYHLRRKQLHNYKFRRQYSVGTYVVDFYCPKAKLAIEIDGDSHYAVGAEQYDRARENYLQSYGIVIVRFTNADVCQNIENVVEKISMRMVNLPSPLLGKEGEI